MNPLFHISTRNFLPKLVKDENIRQAQILIEMENADVNTVDEDGNSALHYASKNALLNFVKYLLAHGANPNLVNNIGNTPLHALGSSSEAMKLDADSVSYVMTIATTLVEFGADPSIPNKTNKFAYQFFISFQIRKYLLYLTNHVSVLVSEDCLHAILGRHWSKATLLQTRYNVVLEYKHSTDRVGEQMVSVWGSVLSVNACLTEIESIVQEVIKSSSLLHNDSYSVVLSVPKEYHLYLVGVNGSTAKSFRKKYQIRLYIPNKESTDTEVRICGRKDRVHACITHMMDIINSNTQSKSKNVSNSPDTNNNPSVFRPETFRVNDLGLKVESQNTPILNQQMCANPQMQNPNQFTQIDLQSLKAFPPLPFTHSFPKTQTQTQTQNYPSTVSFTQPFSENPLSLNQSINPINTNSDIFVTNRIYQTQQSDFLTSSNTSTLSLSQSHTHTHSHSHSLSQQTPIDHSISPILSHFEQPIIHTIPQRMTSRERNDETILNSFSEIKEFTPKQSHTSSPNPKESEEDEERKEEDLTVAITDALEIEKQINETQKRLADLSLLLGKAKAMNIAQENNHFE